MGGMVPQSENKVLLFVKNRKNVAVSWDSCCIPTSDWMDTKCVSCPLNFKSTSSSISIYWILTTFAVPNNQPPLMF